METNLIKSPFNMRYIITTKGPTVLNPLKKYIILD